MAVHLDELVASNNGAGLPAGLYRRPTDVVALVRRVLAEHEPLVERRTLRLSQKTSELIGEWHAARLERAVSNLVGNAIKYGPRGGEVEVRVAREAKHSYVWASISVRDSGIGIAPDELAHVFDRFIVAATSEEWPDQAVDCHGAPDCGTARGPH